MAAALMTITEAFDLPRPEDIRAMGFVVRLQEAEPTSHEVKQLVHDYVITPAVERELPRILDEMKQVFDRGEEYGRFIHGSFGSGKSHFMSMLSFLLESVPAAWDKFRPILGAHRQALQSGGKDAADHEAWLSTGRLLVVRIHMLSVRGKSTSLDRAIYEGFNSALKRRGKEPFSFLNLDSIFQEVRQEAARYGDIVWKQLEAEGIVGGQADFDAVASGSEKARERFARAWLAYKHRDPEDAGIDPRWSEGLRKMAEHVKAQGFGGIVLMIDEFLLWLAEKSGQEFVAEINNLNVVVDHNTGQRSAPVFVFVARQRNLQEFFPDLVDESKIHEHLDHHAKRFEITSLQDVELRHIVKGRVLQPREPGAVHAAIESLAEQHQKALPALLAGGDFDYLRDVYPFHPALIEMLVDVTSLMQRERSALRLLYELLVLHYPDLPLGEFLPVGSAFAAIFPASGVEASKKVELMQDIHHQYYVRLAPAMQQMLKDSQDFNEERRRALDQLVKTVLLAEVSYRLRGASGLTIERLVQLNSVDIEGETVRGQVRIAETDLLALSQKVPEIQIAGSGKTALVRYVLGRVSLGEILSRARSKVDNTSQRFAVFWGALKKALGLDDEKGFEPGGGNEGDWILHWRKTRRRGQIKLGNTREMSYDDFEAPAAAFKIIIDYPWDEPGHTVDEDRMRANNARKSKGAQFTTCWLPRHMSQSELGVLTELAAVRYLLSGPGQDDLLETLGPQDRSKVLDQAATREKTLQGQLDELLREVYISHGEFYSLVSDIDGSRPRDTLSGNLEHIAALLMDRQYPAHPGFLAEPKKSELELLVKWMLEAGETNVSVQYDDATGKVLKALGQPLELVNLGQSKASLRLDSRYIKDVMQRADQDSLLWAPVAEHLRDTYGLQPLVIDLFVCFLCQRDHRALHATTADPVDVRIGMAPTPIRLQRGNVVGHAEWSRLRDLGSSLFGLQRPPAQRSLQIQDRFVAELKAKGHERRVVLQGLHERLVHLGADGSDRCKEVATANQRLGPLGQTTTDSHKILVELLTQWPEDPSDPLPSLVGQATAIRDALADLNDASRNHLKNGLGHPVVGAEVEAHLEKLDGRLKAAQVQQPLEKQWVRSWNQEAQKLIGRLIQAPPPPVVTPPPVVPLLPVDPPPVMPRPLPPVAKSVLIECRIDPSDGDALGEFVGKVRQALQAQGPGSIRVVVVREEATE